MPSRFTLPQKMARQFGASQVMYFRVCALTA